MVDQPTHPIEQPANPADAADAPASEAPAAPAAPAEETPKDEPHPNWFVRQWRGWIRPIGVTILVVVAARSSIADWNDVPSGSMEPTILVGDRIVVNKLSYDLRVPFTAMEAVRWGQPERGQVITFWNPDTGTRMVKRIVGVPGDTLEIRKGDLYINGQLVPRTGPTNPGAARTNTPYGRYNQPLEYQETLGGNTYTIHSDFPFDDVTFPPLRLENGRVIGIQNSTLMVDGQPVGPDAFQAVLGPELQRIGDGIPQRSQYALWLELLDRYQKVTNFGPVTLNDLPGRADLDEFWVMGDHRDNSLDSRYYDNRVTSKSITGHAMFIAWSLDESWVPRFGRFFDGLSE